MNGKQFKASREKLELSQDQLAQILGLSGKQAISNIETGLRNPGTLAASVLRLLVELPEKRSKEIQELLISFNVGSHTSKGRRS